jgi:hypothetical protein
MPKKPRKFFSGPWNLVADPPPCDTTNPGRALKFCELARREQRCECVFDFESIAEDLEELGLSEYARQLEDELDPDALGELVQALLGLLGSEADGPKARLRTEFTLMQKLVDDGSGLKPLEEA